MADYVVRHTNKGVLPGTVSVPEGAEDQLDERVAALGPGWSLDRKTDPALIVPGEQPTVSAKKES